MCALEPGTRRALRLRDLNRRHLLGDLPAQANSLAVAAHSREIEPLVRGDEIDRNGASDRIHHAKLEEAVRADGRIAKRRTVNIEQFETSHMYSPLLRLPVTARTWRAPSPPAERGRISGENLNSVLKVVMNRT